MLEAFGLGLVAQSSLLLAGLLVFWVEFPRRVVGVLAGFGAGALLSAIAFDLVAEAEALESWQFALWMLVGVGVFVVGDYLVERRFGDEGPGASMGIVVGSVVDGVPESIIFGIQIATGYPLSPSFLSAVFVSNVPQAVAPSADLAEAGPGAPAGSASCGPQSYSPAASRPRSATSRPTSRPESTAIGRQRSRREA
jgi:zinc transporter, ZIP family